MTNKEAAAIVERIRYYMEGGECWTDAEFIAMDMAIEALTAQPNDDDTISRQAAIDAMENTDWYHINKDGQLTHGANSSEDEPLYKAEDVYKVLNDMPSVPPNLQPTCNNLATDAISRQAAIDLVKDVCDAIMSGCESWYDPETEDEVYKDILEVDAILKCNKEVRIALRNMPSAQPEILRCKDCKWYELPSHKITENCVRWMKSNGILLPIKPNDYCSYAERRTNGVDC